MNHNITYEALKKGTRDIKLIDFLIKNPAGIYRQLMEKALNYIRLDYEVQALKKDKKVNQTETQKLDIQGHEGERRNYSVF